MNIARIGLTLWLGVLALAACNGKTTEPQPQQPQIILSPSALYFGALAGATPPASTLSISNGGIEALNWKATYDSAWLVLDADSGTAPSIVGVSVATAGMGSGVYWDTIVVTDTNAVNSPQKCPVQLTIAMDLSAYFVLPGPGFDKFFDDATTQTYVKDTTVNGIAVADLQYSDGRHVYYRKTDRGWVATFTPPSSWFVLDPPLVAPPPEMVYMVEHLATSEALATPANVPISMTSQLVDTGLMVTVPAGTYDSVVLVRQIFRLFGTGGLGQPETTVDSTYRWFAPGIDEIRRVQWNLAGDSVIRQLAGGSAGP